MYSWKKRGGGGQIVLLWIFYKKKKNESMTFRVTTSAHLATSSVTLGTPSASLSLAVLVETLRPMSALPTALGCI